MADARGESGGRRISKNRRDRRLSKHRQEQNGADAAAENFQLCCDADNGARGGGGEVVTLGGAANGSGAPLEARARYDEDARMIFLCNYVTKSMKIKHDKWARMLQTEEYNRTVVEFLEKDLHPALFITINFNGTMIADTILARVLAVQGAKNCYFVKRSPGAVRKVAPAEGLIFGDFSNVLTNSLVALNEEVLFPLIKTQIESKRWPPIMQENVDKQLNEFNSALYQMKGSLDGITLLPLPHEVNAIKESTERFQRNEILEDDVALKALMDSYISKWCAIITNILKNSPQALFQNNQYPGPLQELNFWTQRADNLNNIYKQLKMHDAKEVLAFAEMWQSANLEEFHKTFQLLVGGIVESKEVSYFMTGLKEHFTKFEELNINELIIHIGPLLHCIGLLWRKCKYYRRNERVGCLFQEVANSLIQACARTLNPYSLFMGDAEETIQKIYQASDAIGLFLSVYEIAKTNVACHIEPWLYSTASLFERLFKFQERLHLIESILSTSLIFNKLEKIELGGGKGGALTKNIAQIHDEFLTRYLSFQNVQYNVLDLDDNTIHRDYKAFVQVCNDFDNRLATIFVWAFAECHNLEACYKFVHVLGVFAEREVIQAQLRPHYKKMIRMLEDELGLVRSLCETSQQLGGDYNGLNYPPLYNTVRRLGQLRGRIEKHLNDFKEVTNEETATPNAAELMRGGEELVRTLIAGETDAVNKWLLTIPPILASSMPKSILAKREHRWIVNIDAEFLAVLKELKHVQDFGGADRLEEAARVIYERYDELTSTLQVLTESVQWYNYILKVVNEEEIDIIREELGRIEGMFEQGRSTLTWSDNNLAEAKKMQSVVKTLYERKVSVDKHIKSFEKSLEHATNKSIFGRSDPKSAELISLFNRDDEINRRYRAIEYLGKELDMMLKTNFVLIYNVPLPTSNIEKVDELQVKRTRYKSEQSVVKFENYHAFQSFYDRVYIERALCDEKWLSYLRRFQQRISAIFLDATRLNLSFFIYEMEINENANPLFSITIEWQETQIEGLPSLRADAPDNFLTRVEKLLAEIFAMAHKLSDNPAARDAHIAALQADGEVQKLSEAIRSRCKSMCAHIGEYLTQYDAYKCLFLGDRDEHLKHFLKYARIITIEDWPHLNGDGNDPQGQWQWQWQRVEAPERTPTLAQFKEQIAYFEALCEKVARMEDTRVLQRWLLLDVRPLKHALMNAINKWAHVFKRHLHDCVINGISELETFARDAVELVGRPVVANDAGAEALIRIMSCLAKIKERQLIADNMFEPLRMIIDLLRYYDVDFPEAVRVRLQELPALWENCKKVAGVTKQIMAPLQASQVNAIRRKLAFFDLQQSAHREYFKALPIFYYDCADIYAKLDKCHAELDALESTVDRLREQSALFELQISEFKHVAASRRELRLLKELWDYVVMCNSWIDEWKYTPWKRIDVEAMDMDCKKFGKDLRAMDKELRAWDVYIQMEANLKNMLTSLRAVTELQNPSIRERHWNQLMKTIKTPGLNQSYYTVKFVMDPATTLNDLLALRLHEYEDDVRNIVDKSIKEVTMEKTIRDLHEAWSTRDFEFEVHDRTQINILLVAEELIETLEDHQVQLQNMLTSKFIEFFYSEITDWQTRLSNVDQVIAVFLDVQRKWGYLESIFIGSEDIRSQLSADSQRFDDIDRTFKRILRRMHNRPNILAATNAAGFYEHLERLLADLVQCEKALNDYLETKRLAFPRFYFLSSADLLDILSNGNQPDLIQRHLTKLFDSLARLSFTPAASAKSDKRAAAMFSKENEERVDFHAACVCAGKVEIWLGALIETMRETLRMLFGRAVGAYVEKARDAWIYEYPAQVALVCIQIWWSTETHAAFARLEEGYESALKDYSKKQISQLNTLIAQLLGELSAGDRQKVMTICTIDVHSRDVITKLIAMKVENAQAFQWQSQLRHQWDVRRADCDGHICDAQIRYQYEYLGNTPRLVITPLTDRCYITLTQSLHLVMGGAPAGPAGTGKTETTKDLGKALGIMVYVFNCSEQMDYKSVGNIYKGLVQTGTWGCFDEFNRISVEVLSVVAVQVKTIQDAIKHRRVRFRFLDEEIRLVDTVGIFITMNPGYAGRTELPENLKALFRPCAMVVPDFELICEIMLVAEGFQDARVLARKFITLYTLCRELLSKQDHYDWGLRAIKSVLVVAGALKRGDRQRPEDQVLMRALRDFNIPKIISDDVPIFMGLIRDLFPALDVPRKRDADFEKLVKKSSADLKLQPEEGFVLKVVQLEELFEVRHSVFIIGFAGTGKSMVWRTLFKTYVNQKRRPVYNDLNPKAVTNNELFGVINPATREWRDGLFSAIMREQANLPGGAPRWIVLDGDIDPMWIESLNTLMDDNKVLTLASNERIALTPQMRLIFEIANLRSATPATVSRAGILYINPKDLGWNPYAASWLDARGNPTERTLLSSMFDKYVPPCLEVLETKFKKITPLVDVTHLSMLCHLLDCFLTPESVPLDCPREWYEIYFVFCAVWAFGSSLFQDQLDGRAEFSKWFQHEYKAVRFPPNGCVFDYYVDERTKLFAPWANLIDKFELSPEITLQAALVETMETRRIRYLLDRLMKKRIPCMLIGPAGCGKSVLVGKKLAALPEHYQVTNVPFNFYTTAEMLQKMLEKPLEKKAGRVFGPPGNKQMVYFIDDMNMPEVDKYFTVQPHALLRQHIDYQHWYDRQKLSLKEIQSVQYVSCMNPTAGSFAIDPRLQRHFCVFSLNPPAGDALFAIYDTILKQHLLAGNFNAAVNKLCPTVVAAALALHLKVAGNFLPTAVKFHYIFNMRDLSNVFQGMLFTGAECVATNTDFIRLWMHESMRVYGDKMVSYKDLDAFTKALNEIAKKSFEEFDEGGVMQKPLIFCHFAEGIGDPKYLQVFKYERLNKLLAEAQASYNELVAAMNLVLFEDAMNHICRINRILEAPRGNLLLVGVGGTGKQSLTRLAAFIASLDVAQVQLKKGYSINDLKLDIAAIYLKAGMKNVSTAFLMTDSQVADEQFLVLVNYMLASGEIPDLLTDDETEEMLNLLKSEVKAAGLADTKENCWKLYVDKVRKLIKVVLCFSPVGSTLRIRARKFPAIINCTAINWFHDWPKEALLNVSKRFLAEIGTLPAEYVASASEFMSFVHIIVNKVSQTYLACEKRYNYTTPKTFLEQIALYAKLLSSKTQALKQNIQRLENGLMKLKSTSCEVDALQEVLAVQEVELGRKNEAADKLIKILRAENEKVAKEQALASDEEAKVKIIEEDVAIKARMCEEDLRKAEPALEAAMEALNTLNKSNLTELKSFGSPPDAVVNVCAAVLVLFAKRAKIPKDRSWKACKMLMGKVDQFLNDLLCYDKENIHPDVVRAVLPYVNDPEFEPNKIHTKSIAAAGLCAWVINIMRYYDIYLVVEPKRKALQKASAELKCARQTLKDLKETLQQLEKQLSALRAEYEEAIDAKLKCQMEADATATMINLARRLINGLASEKHRWRESVGRFQAAIRKLPGDVLLVTAFVSYVGCFTRKYRAELIKRHWIPYLGALAPPVPTTAGLDPLTLLTDDALIANWNNEGLPTDRMSSENATILSNTARWPLMIDPQLQGIKWIKNRYGGELVVIRLGTRNYLDTIERCVSLGSIVLLENIGETIDGVLDPILSRVLVKKGKLIKIGDKEVDYDPRFKLIIQTKLGNPHYKPEIQAQTTLINFTVTRSGLEEQLLAEVVKAERPELETSKALLTKQQNDFKITLKTCEDNLLERLSSATGNILEDVTLVTNLETTKSTAADISVKAAEAKVTSAKIDIAREQYRPASARASLLYFILNDLNRINPIYQFSLKAFTSVFKKSLSVAQQAGEIKPRVVNLLDSITYGVCMYTSRGLFERDKLIFLAQMTLQILVYNKEIAPVELDFLLRFPVTTNLTSPYDFLSNALWGGVKALSCMEGFRGLDKDIEHSLKRWRKFVDSECPEKDKLPGEWKNKSALQRLCIMRCLRPDRMTYAVRAFIEEKLGAKFVQARTIPFEQSFEETSSSTPILFILSPGVNPLADVATLGLRLGYTLEAGNFCAVALGQGQEAIAEAAIDRGATEGHWVMLQNIHLVERWLPALEKKIEQQSERAHPDYRLYMSADPAANVLPQGILESSIKITNESPAGMLANLHKALDNFTQESLEQCTKEVEFRAILFSLCYFHAVVAERRKFGPQGWNRDYPFNVGDLTISVNVLYNYLENNSRVPWEDLRYLFGEIMYGGHITDDWDRRLCRNYLLEYMQPLLLDGDLHYAPGFRAPTSTDYVGYHRYIDEHLPPESPYLYGLHPNAEIGCLTGASEVMFKTIFEMQSQNLSIASGVGMSREEKVRATLDDILEKLPEAFHIKEMLAKVEDRTPYVIVCLQECERMNALAALIRSTLKELALGLKGELTITPDMEMLEGELFLDKVPLSWAAAAYPSLLPLGRWCADLNMRIKELENWTSDFSVPCSVWLGGLFNPQSFLTAIMQQMARRHEWPLDKMCLQTEVTRKQRDDITSAPKEGANVHGLYIEGARWDVNHGVIADAVLKELFPMLPVVYLRAITQDKQDLRNTYECPVYKTRARGPTYVWTFNLKTREKQSKWVLAGVATLLQV